MTKLTKHGLVLGKFKPLTNGHIYLIERALVHAEQVTLLVCTLASEPLDGALRFEWVRETFPAGKYPNLNLVHATDEVPSYPHQHHDFWTIWRNLIHHYAPGVDAVFTSEEY